MLGTGERVRMLQDTVGEMDHVGTTFTGVAPLLVVGYDGVGACASEHQIRQQQDPCPSDRRGALVTRGHRHLPGEVVARGSIDLPTRGSYICSAEHDRASGFRFVPVVTFSSGLSTT
jgi:hypothetical protein